MIIVIRGTNGSGKSYAVRQILAGGTKIKMLDEESALVHLARVTHPVLIIGPYTKGRSMGGCDCIRQPSKIYKLIDHALFHQWHVVLEGVVLATKPYLEYHEAGEDIRYAFLDPPFQTCLDQITARQRAKGHTSKVSRAAMRRKRERAEEMYVAAKQVGMITTRWTTADAMVRWVGYQLRRA